jgi:hypothetical protein
LSGAACGDKSAPAFLLPSVARLLLSLSSSAACSARASSLVRGT